MSENQGFSDIFRGYRNGAQGYGGLMLYMKSLGFHWVVQIFCQLLIFLKSTQRMTNISLIIFPHLTFHMHDFSDTIIMYKFVKFVN